ncbi:MAG: hypothetical protein HY909_15735 [Deltaproteobacteria bacterium]|nr:hypothetical protein [Deltaproteobacteria bacterium]
MELVVTVVRTVMPLYPPEFQGLIERALPAIVLDAMGLAVEVSRAEMSGIPYAEAVTQITFPQMARLHYGLEDWLQRRVPTPLLDAVKAVVRRAVEGDFDPVRSECFARAARRGDAEGALLRFVLYEAVRFNLLVGTWDQPVFAAVGTLRRIDEYAQGVVDDMVELPLAELPDVRPLDVLVREVMLCAIADVHEAEAAARADDPAHLGALERVIGVVRALDAKDAAVMRPSSFENDMGSQQITDRYPEHFPSVNAVDQRRSRLRRAIEKGRPPINKDGDRLIDLLLAAAEEMPER